MKLFTKDWLRDQLLLCLVQIENVCTLCLIKLTCFCFSNIIPIHGFGHSDKVVVILVKFSDEKIHLQVLKKIVWCYHFSGYQRWSHTANTCIPPSFAGNMSAQMSSIPTNKACLQVYKNTKRLSIPTNKVCLQVYKNGCLQVLKKEFIYYFHRNL
jgi:hypothetical protein